MFKTRMSSSGRYVIVLFCGTILLSGVSCGPKASTSKEMLKFNSSGSSTKKVKYYSGPYKVVPGDVLEFEMPAALWVTSADLTEWIKPNYGSDHAESYLVRVSEKGSITLPIVGDISVSDYTLAQIEKAVIDAYYPKYVVDSPMLSCTVAKYQGENERNFSVLGLVRKPDTFTYPPDVQYNVMEVIAFAGGLDPVTDPRWVKIYRQNDSGEAATVTLSINNKSITNASKVMIKPGDIVYVDHTMRTRVNKFFSDVFHIGVGADASYTGN
ncbi:MAG: polysaccharide biosynthesis/export family protein [Phycisphaerae bacterium]|nr:polysaccharide biosynthesis/export family protein [Phycisphaerae bacterium]